MSFRFPPALRPGATVAVIAPASPFPTHELWPGLAWLRLRYRLVMRSSALERTGYLAGTVERRVRELAWALGTPGIDAVLAARGGFGTMHLLEHVDFAAAMLTPRWLIGFSDLTAAHADLSRVRVASIHGPNATGLGRASPAVRHALLQTLERPGSTRPWVGLGVLVAGTARGVVFGGNLALLEAMAAAGRLAVPEGAVLLLEDVTERPYRIDRMLTALRLGGHLARISAIVLGEFAECSPGPDGVTAHEVLAAHFASLGVPVLFGAPFGHGLVNQPFVLGQEARVSGDGTVTFLANGL
ncbi:MAG: LD-carboxypeptidase [Myxococcales bacterium]|nr:LD-carboxypeptidase [Myxococcales bacterium]